MHCPSMFREERLDVLHNLISAPPLATLITAGSNGLMANRFPLRFTPEGNTGYCVRIWRGETSNWTLFVRKPRHW